jgi:quinol monooxygenase YgiN/ketosteroid isomerase-like protein
MEQQSHTVKAVFTFKDSASKDKFIEFCNGDNGLSVTRGWQGCQSIECYQSNENSNQVIIWQKWENQEAHESYVKHRHDDGSFDFLGELIASPPEITPLKPVVFKTDREQIEEIVRDMCNVDHTLGIRHMHDKCLFIRPSGNPLDMKGWVEMMTNTDVKVESNDLVGINKVEVLGNMAYVCYTTHGKFNYKGTQNDDVAVLTSILEKVDDKWQVVFGQRSTGRSPNEEVPVFAEV